MANPSTNSPWVVLTTTSVSLNEITSVLDKGQKLLADMSIASAYAILYRMPEPTKICLRKRLYLALYAIQSWDIKVNAQNFFDQAHLIKMMSFVEQQFYIVQVSKSC